MQAPKKTTDDPFVLNCRVEKRKRSYREKQSRGREWNEQAEVVLLVPDVTDEATEFFDAWLGVDLTPEERAALKIGDQISEVGMLIGHPVHGFTRGVVMRSSIDYPKAHIFVMTKKSEERLLKWVGKKIRVDVLPESEIEKHEDGAAETAPTIEGLL